MTRRALITGGSRGIGREVARQLAAAGLDVTITARDAEVARRVAADIGTHGEVLDVSDPASVAALSERLTGDLDVLVNNAGVALDGFDAEVVRRTAAVNLFGVIGLTDALLPRLAAGARIVNVSSGLGALDGLSPRLHADFDTDALDRAGLRARVAAFAEAVAAGRHTAEGWPSSAYRISKVGLNAFTRRLHVELADDPRGIRVVAVCPGWVRTDMGGPGADRSVEEGADTIVWAATSDGVPSGVFLRDRAVIPW